MTIQKTENTISHLGDGVTITFPYDFRVDREEYMFVTINGYDYEGPILVEGIGDPEGGEVTFLDDFIPAEGDVIVLYRRLDLKQVIDYRDYDAFPAETHELGLDNLTMMLQQHDERIQSSVQMPVGDTANQVLPNAEERAEKFLYFDIDGNATAFEADIDQPYVTALEIDDGSFGGYPSKEMLRVDTQSEGATKPKLSVITPNQANALLQLDDQGKIPLGLNRIIGMKVRGPYRGDDLCPKPGDDPGDCTDPDYRNPSERFPQLVDTFAGGDTFIVSFAEGETEGSINAYPFLGADTMEPVDVTLRDVLIYLPEVVDPNDEAIILNYAGWYVIKNFVEVGDALFVSYNDTGNAYVLGGTVQAALDSTDDHLQARDAWLPNSRDAGRTGIEAAVPNAINQSGMYYAGPGSPGMPSVEAHTILHIQTTSTLGTQFAIDMDSGEAYVRNYISAWLPWYKLANAAEFLQLAGGVLTGTLEITGQTDGPCLRLVENGGNVPDIKWVNSDDSELAMYNTPGGLVFEFYDSDGVLENTRRITNGSLALGTDITTKQYVDNNLATRKSNNDFLRTGTRLDINNVRTS